MLSIFLRLLRELFHEVLIDDGRAAVHGTDGLVISVINGDCIAARKGFFQRFVEILVQLRLRFLFAHTTLTRLCVLHIPTFAGIAGSTAKLGLAGGL